MDKIVIKGKEYKIISNKNNYELKVDENNLILKRGEKPFFVLDLQDVDFPTTYDILSCMDIRVELIEALDLYDMWLERNPGKNCLDFISVALETVANLAGLHKNYCIENYLPEKHLEKIEDVMKEFFREYKKKKV
ncbi:hypothetical protein [Cetobacterium sp.]|uniref:hypothetical protein n=1 Tax=Cetobacterium sp. TaxID=2071632 RepID=UPI003EE80D7E